MPTWHGRAWVRGSKNSTAHGRGFGGMKQVYYQSDQYYPVNILEFAAVPRQQSLHPSQKPVDLLAHLIRTYSRPGETVLDFCMGSGSTGVACAAEGRNFIGIEKDTEYFEIAHRRIAAAFSAARQCSLFGFDSLLDAYCFAVAATGINPVERIPENLTQWTKRHPPADDGCEPGGEK